MELEKAKKELEEYCKKDIKIKNAIKRVLYQLEKDEEIIRLLKERLL